MENEMFISNRADDQKSQCEQENSNFPMHRLVWNNNYVDLRDFLKQFQPDMEQRDNRGRTPLHLAIALGHLECANVLLESGASAIIENLRNWTVVQEAVSTGDPEMVQLCLQYRDYQRHMERLHGVPKLLKQLEEAPDFYVEMKWEFTSWVPLVSRICPSDTYKVWKSGSNVRIDTTLLGFDNMSWQRGSRSYLFKLHGNTTTLLEIDYDNCQVYSETLSPTLAPPTVTYMSPSTNAVAARLTSPIVTTYVDIDKISFERSKSGVWGWRSDRMDVIDNFTCKVFSASNVQLATKTRTEHLSEDDKRRIKKQSRTPFESFLGVAETDPKNKGADNNGPSTTSVCHNPCHVTEEEYFGSCDLEGRDIGRPVEEMTKVQKLKARFWLCEDYPLSLPDQVVPIIDLMASSNTHFRKLKDFIALQLPSGFPVKIEIPLFHVLNARITFTNLFSRDAAVDGVTPIRSEGDHGEVLACAIDESTFAVPSSYSVIGDTHHERLQDEDDELYQFTLRQSLLQQSENDERIQDLMLKRTRSSHSRLASEEERLLQWALEESLKESRSCDSLPPLMTSTPPGTPPPYSQLPISDELLTYQPLNHSSSAPNENDYDRQLRIALELSQKEEEEALLRRRQDDEELARIMELSLVEK